MLALFSSGIIVKKEIMVADIPKSVARIKTVEIDIAFLLNIKIVSGKYPFVYYTTFFYLCQHLKLLYAITFSRQFSLKINLYSIILQSLQILLLRFSVN